MAMLATITLLWAKNVSPYMLGILRYPIKHNFLLTKKQYNAGTGERI